MDNKKIIFTKKNYLIMIVGIAVLFLGFFIMLSDDSEYGFGFKALTLAPIVILTGFGIQFYAIFSGNKNEKPTLDEDKDNSIDDLDS